MRPKIGLVLGGGGSRGGAHIGVLEILVREQIPVDLIVGTSMGGIVGTLFAAGIAPEELVTRFEQLQGLTLNVFSSRARQRAVYSWLKDMIQDRTFADLQIPLSLMAVDMIEGQEVELSEGELMPAILASSAMPAVFPPVDWRGMKLADGGVIDSLSTHIAFKRGADKVIAVDIYPPLKKDFPWVDPLSAIMGIQLPFATAKGRKDPGMITAVWRASRVMAHYLHEARLAVHPPDILLCPDVSHYSSLDFKDVKGPVEAGRSEAESHLDELKALIENV